MIKAIFASTRSGGIGNKGSLPWPTHSEDFKWFKEHTTNQIVIMGRNTWDDPKMPKPLPNRDNYVVSSKPLLEKHQSLAKWIPGNVKENVLSIQKQNPTKDVFLIGGAKLLESSIEIVDEMIWTRMKPNYWADTRVDIEKWLPMFRLKTVKPGTDCTFEIWSREFFKYTEKE
jgi:dihydrofolate reductase